MMDADFLRSNAQMPGGPEGAHLNGEADAQLRERFPPNGEQSVCLRMLHAKDKSEVRAHG